MTVAYITHPSSLLHEMGPDHPERPQRIIAIDTALKQSGLLNKLKPYLAPQATHEQLLRVHTADYLNSIVATAPQPNQSELVSLDPDTWMNAHTLTAAYHAAGAVVLAVDLVMRDEVQAAFCNVRPPGHHAEKNRAMGFCFFNNIAVGVAHALTQHQLTKVAIVDFDVHHGNGTEDIFKDDDRVLFCSSFEHPFYPYSGANTHKPHILNIPLPAGTNSELFREKVQSWFAKLEAFKPELIFFSAGFDAHADDVMADILLKADDYAWITREVKLIADKVCQGRLISALEGGYALEALGQSAVAHVTFLTHN